MNNLATSTGSRTQRTAVLDAQRELARRKLAQRHLIDFCAYVDPDAAWPGAADTFIESRYRARHLALIGEYIERAVAGTLWNDVPGDGTRILLITTPPGHWKSSLVSRKFPAWFVGHQKMTGQPHQVILSSYNATLATSNNRAVLELVRDSYLYRNIFPEINLSAKSQSSEEWSLEGEPFPCCVAAGVGGGLTGYHGDVAIVDDPIKDRAQANSPAYLESLWDWWKDVLRTRINRNGFILGIWTRWSEGDPAGRLFKEKQEGKSEERIVLLRLPALAETQAERQSAASMGLPVDKADPLGRRPGEALWPEIKSSQEHRATRRTYPITFESLDQGRPRPAGGFVAGREQFKILPAEPQTGVRWVWGTDWAITEREAAPRKGDDPDYTVAVRVGLWQPIVGGDVRLVIADVRRGQCNPHDARKLVKGAILTRKAPVRSGQDNIDKVHLFELRSDPDLIAYSIKKLSREEMSGDKMTRAQPWLEQAHAGNVYLVEGDWNEEFLSEVERFPHGAHDDQVDAVSVGVHALGLGQRERKASSAKVPGFGG